MRIRPSQLPLGQSAAGRVSAEPYEPVSNCVSGPSREEVFDLRPIVSADSLSADNGWVLVGAPFVLAELRVELVHPPLSALLSGALGKHLSDDGPIQCPKPADAQAK
jgi:hypothetical protein